MKKNELILSIVGLAIVLLGSVGTLILKFPAGLLLLLPNAVPHIIRLCSANRK